MQNSFAVKRAPRSAANGFCIGSHRRTNPSRTHIWVKLRFHWKKTQFEKKALYWPLRADEKNDSHTYIHEREPSGTRRAITCSTLLRASISFACEWRNRSTTDASIFPFYLFEFQPYFWCCVFWLWWNRRSRPTTTKNKQLNAAIRFGRILYTRDVQPRIPAPNEERGIRRE